MMRSEVQMWNRTVPIIFNEHGERQGMHFGEMTLLIPETLHQQLEGKRPLQLVCAGQQAKEFVPGDYIDNKIEYICRITYMPSQRWSVMYGQTAYATLTVDESGEATLFAR